MYSVSYISVSSRARPFIPYITLTDFEDEDVTLPVVRAPLSPDYMLASPEYTSDSNLDSNLIEDDSSDEDLIETDEPLQAQTTLTPFRLRPDRSLMMRTPRKRVRTPVTLSLAIEAAIADEIAAPPRKRDKLSPPLAPSLPPPSPLPSPSPSRKRSRSPSPPLPPLPSSPPSDMLLLCKRVWMTPLQTETSEETEGAPNIYEIEESSTANILPVTGELVHHTMSLAKIAEQRTEDLHDILGRARDEIVEHQVRHEDTEAHLQQSEASVIELKLEDQFGM
nr:hypothetical protein [Tanacetum cinerariifolium]